MNITHPDDRKQDVSLQSLYYSLILNSGFLLVTVVVFELLLKSSRCARFLAPRLNPNDHKQLRKMFGWLRLVWMADMTRVEPDGRSVIIFCDFGFKFSIVGSLFDAFLMPFYASADPCHACVGFNRYSISNLGPADTEESSEKRFWATVISAYILTGYFCCLVASEWRSFIAMRRANFIRVAQGLAGTEAAQSLRSVMVECVPEPARSHTGVHNFFESLFGKHAVHSCVLHNDASDLYTSQSMYNVYNGDDNSSQRKKCCRCCCKRRYAIKQIRKISDHPRERESLAFHVELPEPSQRASSFPLKTSQSSFAFRTSFEESAFPQMARNRSPSPTQSQTSMRVTWDSHDEKRKLREVLDHGVERASNVGTKLLKRATSLTEMLQQVTIGQTGTSTAFVTFRSVALAVLAEQTLLSHDPGWLARRAPEARNLFWFNVQKPLGQLQSRRRLVEFGCVLGVLFWSLPMAAIQAWANVNTLKDYPFISELREDYPIFFSIVTNYLPVIALYGLQQLLPPLFQCIAIFYEGHKIKSEVECIVLNRYILFILASLYFTTLSGTLWSAIKEIVETPKNFLLLLSHTLPTMAVYFMTYVLAGVGVSFPWYLFRLWELLLYGSDVSAVHCDLATALGPMSLTLFIGLTFSFIAPAILPFCALYFGCMSIMFRWVFLCVYEQDFDGDGEVWYGLCNSLLIGLFMGVVLLMSMALTYATRLQLLVLTPLPFFVIVFIWYCRRGPLVVSKRRALDDAVMADEATSLFVNRADLYLDPLVKAQLRH